MAGVASVRALFFYSFTTEAQDVLNYRSCAATVRTTNYLSTNIELRELIDLVNNTYACENDKMLNDVLKREYGFQGCKFAPTARDLSS